MSKLRYLLIPVFVLMLTSSVYAQEGEDPTPTFTPTFTPTPTVTPTPTATVTPTTTIEPIPQLPPVPPYHLMGVSVVVDEYLTLHGDLYLVDSARITVLLLHEMYTDRTSWNPVWPGLLAGGYNVLAVDVRGHGLSWGAAIDWYLAVNDVQLWIDWLRENNLTRIITMGSSMGSSLAINGCANDTGCLGVVAISPGWNYYDISVSQAFASTLASRPALVVLAQYDPWPMRGVPRMVEAATNDLTVHEYPGNAHGMLLFNTEAGLLPYIVQWLQLTIGL